MLCPKCGEEMGIMSILQEEILIDLYKHQEVLGRCEECDFDATWERVYVPRVGIFDRDVREFNLKRYFFG